MFIQLTDPLDEPQFYCLDVPGAGTAVRLDSPLQAHTCKPLRTAEDELFTFNHPNDGQIYMEAYDLCVEATGSAAGSTVGLAVCSDSPNQRFAIEDGAIRLASGGPTGLCLAVDPGDGIPTGGPSHLRRDLTLESCDSIDPALSRWIFGIFDY
ncbi:MAG: RICIN domain-containing protein [Chloroflexi bacterium]|nr:RICIN domain-containing protein [Chloroflexota bacterium]